MHLFIILWRLQKNGLALIIDLIQLIIAGSECVNKLLVYESMTIKPMFK